MHCYHFILLLMARNRIILYEHTVSYDDFVVDTEQSRVRILSRVLILLVSVEISKTWNIRQSLSQVSKIVFFIESV